MQHPDAVAGVITVGTPHQGSWLATGFSIRRPCLRPPCSAGLLARMVKTVCDLSGIKDLLCVVLGQRRDPAVRAMRTDVDAKSGWRALPRWPDGKLVTAAATVTGPWDSMWPLKVPLPLDVMGDAVVSVLSQHAGRDKDTLSRDGFT